MRTAILTIQTITFVVLGLVMLCAGETRFGLAQFALAGVNTLVYA